MNYYAKSNLNPNFTHHNTKIFEETNDCFPFKCSLSTLFWYLMKTLGILGVNEMNIILNFLHSSFFDLKTTPKLYHDLEKIEPFINKGK